MQIFKNIKFQKNLIMFINLCKPDAEFFSIKDDTEHNDKS